MPIQPAPQPSKAKQTVSTQQTVSNVPAIAALIAAGTITQDRVNAIVAAAVERSRLGE